MPIIKSNMKSYHAKDLQQITQTIDRVYSEYGMIMNKKKTKVMLIEHERNTMCKITWQNEEIGRVQECQCCPIGIPKNPEISEGDRTGRGGG